jgi:hypothetical protein
MVSRENIVKSIISYPPFTMSTPCIATLIPHIPASPTLLFQVDIDSANNADSHNDDAAAIEETLPTQGPEDSGKVNELAPSSGLMYLSAYVDMR